MRTIRITAAQYLDLCELQVKEQERWDAAFSTNPNGEIIWPKVVAGRTPDAMRVDVSGVSVVLDKIAAAVCDYRDLGGRFFINTEGVFWKKDGPPQKFIEWDSRGQKLKNPRQVKREQMAAALQPITFKELRRRQAEAIARK